MYSDDVEFGPNCTALHARIQFTIHHKYIVHHTTPAVDTSIL